MSCSNLELRGKNSKISLLNPIKRLSSIYNQVTKLRPKDVSTYSNRANARAESGDHKGAIAERTAALKIDPNGVLSLFIYNDRGLSYLALGNPKSAIAKR